MKKITLLFVLSLTAISFAQNVEVVNGEQFQMNKSSEQIVEILNMDRNDFSFLTQKGRKNFRVMSLDSKLKMDVSKEIELPEVNGKDVKYHSAGQVGERTYFFSQYFDKKGDQMNLFASDLNISNAKFNEHYEAMAINDDGFNRWTRPFKVVRSLDSSKIMFICTYPAKRKENARIAVRVTDNNLKEIWKNDIVFDQENRDFTVLSYLVDTDGNLHMAVQNRMENDEKKEKGAKGRYYVSIFSYFHESSELKEYEIGFKNEIILSANLELNKANEILCTGFYGEKKVFDAGMKGFFFMRIDPKSKEVVAKNLSAFDKNFLSQLMSERKAEKGKGLFGYLVRDTYSLSDGGMAVVTEYYNYSYYQDDNGNTTETWTFGNVIVFFLDGDGNMKTYSILKKNQTCMNRTKNGTTSLTFLLRSRLGLTMVPGVTELPYYGIGTMMKDDKIYMLYNENPKNAERVKAGKKPKSVRERTSETMLVSFDAGGDISSTVLFKSKDKEQGYKMPVMPRYNYQYSKDAMLVIGRRGKSARVVDITVKD